MQQLAPRPSQQSPRPIPYGLVSLWDMYVFYADQFLQLGRLLGELKGFIDRAPEQHGEAHMSRLRASVLGCLQGLKMGCAQASLPLSARLIEKQLADPPMTSSAMQVIFDCVVTEMEQQTYFCMPAGKVRYWNEIDMMDDAAKAAFGEQATILETAATCYSYDLPASCVFHSMQAVETGLRVVAIKLGATITGHENMKTVIGAIETKAKAIEQQPNKSNPNKQSDSQFYSEIATSASNFKNAWRNYVAHGKAPYTDQQAIDVLRDVCRFFNKLAERYSADDLDQAISPPASSEVQPS